MQAHKKLTPTATYLLALHAGDMLHSSLIQFCKKQQILSASYSGIGAVCEVEVGEYEKSTKSYIKKTYDGSYELTSIIGNISCVDNGADSGELFAHSHVTFTDRSKDSALFGGHLFEAKVLAVVEFFIQVYDGTLYRRFDEVTGLNILQG